MMSARALGAAISAVSIGSNVLAAVKIGAVVIGVLGVFGFGYASCQKKFNAGYTAAEADRLEDLAEANASAAAKLRADTASARSAEQRWRAESSRANAAAKAAIEERNAARAPAKGRTTCVPGCTY